MEPQNGLSGGDEGPVSLGTAVARLQRDGERFARTARLLDRVPLAEALGRTLGEDLCARCDHPNVDDSSLDGIACRVQDTMYASPEAPTLLTLVGESAAGRPYAGTVGAGEATWIQTGGAVPEGADGIVPIERVDPRGERVAVTVAADPKAVRRRGQDVKVGDVGLVAGRRLNAAGIALAAAMGHGELTVVRPPRVALLTSGDEVVAPGGSLRPGDVFDANGPALSALLRASGADVVPLATVPDAAGALEATLAGVGDVDLFLTSGGISMGRYDRIRDLLEARATVRFRKVLLKPGGPATFAHLGDLPWLALPGNPVSSTVTFLLLARAWLDAALGRAPQGPFEQSIPAIAAAPLSSAGRKTTLLRVRLAAHGDSIEAVPTSNQNSGVVRSLADADALAIVPPDTAYEPGAAIRVLPLAPLLG